MTVNWYVAAGRNQRTIHHERLGGRRSPTFILALEAHGLIVHEDFGLVLGPLQFSRAMPPRNVQILEIESGFPFVPRLMRVEKAI